jgi:enediyne biosynthesis protein E4
VRVFIAALCALLAAGCPARTSTPVAPPHGPLVFREVAAEMGVTFVCGITDQTPLNITRMVAGGAGFLDYDADGWPDLALVGLRGAALYHNEAGKAFRDVTAGSGLDRLRGEPQGLAAADYDGDDRTDLLVTRYDGVTLLRNVAPGKFQDVTAAAGLDVRGWTTSAAFADVNGDGRLDVFIGRYVQFRPGMPEFKQDRNAMLTIGPDGYNAVRGVLYLNEGGKRFHDATREAGLATSHGKTLGVTFIDFDDDGDQDLYLANDGTLGDCFVNDGRGRFENVAVENGTATSAAGKRQAGMGLDWADYDRDGRLDLIVTTFYNEPKSLYHQDEGGGFTERSQSAGLLLAALRGTAFGVSFTDWNNDGWPDLMIANGHVQDQLDRVDPDTGYRQLPQVFLNERGRFREVSASAGPPFAQRIVGRALAAADFDRDGRRDAVIANFVGPPLLLRNESPAGNWVGIRLAGRPPNTRGIGALVVVSAGEQSQKSAIVTGRSYLAAFPPEAHFGLGEASAVSGEVRWPGGRVRKLPTLKLNTVNVIPEPE